EVAPAESNEPTAPDVDTPGSQGGRGRCRRTGVLRAESGRRAVAGHDKARVPLGPDDSPLGTLAIRFLTSTRAQSRSRHRADTGRTRNRCRPAGNRGRT